MPALSQHQASKFVKMLYIGNSGTGKTGSLVSLVKAGYKLRLLDMDNGVSILKTYIQRDCPNKLDNVEVETCRDKYKITPGGAITDGPPKAFVEAMNILTKWPDGTRPFEWGEDSILVIDSFTALGKAALEWAKGMNPTAKDPRQWYGTAQTALEDVISNLTGEAFKTNLIIISHVDWQELPDGTIKGYTKSIGKALGPIIPRYFNTLLLAESVGSGDNVKRKIRTVPTGMIDLKSSAPFKLTKDYDLGTGLAAIFKILKEEPEAEKTQVKLIFIPDKQQRTL